LIRPPCPGGAFQTELGGFWPLGTPLTAIGSVGLARWPGKVVLPVVLRDALKMVPLPLPSGGWFDVHHLPMSGD